MDEDERWPCFSPHKTPHNLFFKNVKNKTVKTQKFMSLLKAPKHYWFYIEDRPPVGASCVLHRSFRDNHSPCSYTRPLLFLWLVLRMRSGFAQTVRSKNAEKQGTFREGQKWHGRNTRETHPKRRRSDFIDQAAT